MSRPEISAEDELAATIGVVLGAETETEDTLCLAAAIGFALGALSLAATIGAVLGTVAEAEDTL